MTAVEQDAELLIQQVEAAAYTTLENRERVAARCSAFAAAHRSELPQWRLDELDGADEYLQLSTRAGTAANPNKEAVDSDGVAHPTSGAASKKDDSITKEVFSEKTAQDIGANAKKMWDQVQDLLPKILAPLIKGAAKGLWVYVAGAGAVLTLYIIAKKRRWI